MALALALVLALGLLHTDLCVCTQEKPSPVLKEDEKEEQREPVRDEEEKKTLTGNTSGVSLSGVSCGDVWRCVGIDVLLCCCRSSQLSMKQ